MTRGKYGERARSVREARVVAERAEKERRAAVAETKRLAPLADEVARLRAELADALDDAERGTSRQLRESEAREEESQRLVRIARQNLAMMIRISRENDFALTRMIRDDPALPLDKKQRAVVLEAVITTLAGRKRKDLPLLLRAEQEIKEAGLSEHLSGRARRRVLERGRRPPRRLRDLEEDAE